MATTTTAAQTIRRSLKEKDRTFAWLARKAGLDYKRVLREIKHETKPIALDTALAVAPVLDMELPELVNGVAARADNRELATT